MYRHIEKSKKERKNQIFASPAGGHATNNYAVNIYKVFLVEII